MSAPSIVCVARGNYALPEAPAVEFPATRRQWRRGPFAEISCASSPRQGLVDLGSQPLYVESGRAIDFGTMVEALEKAVRTHFARPDREPQLAGEITAKYLLNPGGFVNRSFRVSDSSRSFHLKLAEGPEMREALRSWFVLDATLRKYNSPEIVCWVEIEDINGAGLLTEWIDGASPSTISGDLRTSILSSIARLHDDRHVRAFLEKGSVCADTYLDSYGERFDADLAEISRERPDFVSRALLSRLTEEAGRLASLVRSSAAFREPALSPIHGDLWVNNILVTPQNAWHLVDWDELRVGDPMIDFAMLLGPSASDLNPIAIDDEIAALLKGDAELERLHLYGRASLLDWAIDSLADYIEVVSYPEHAGAVRIEKERLHREAWALYEQLYAKA